MVNGAYLLLTHTHDVSVQTKESKGTMAARWRTCNISFHAMIFSTRSVHFRTHHHLLMLISSRRWRCATLLTLRGDVWSAIYSGVRVGVVYCLLRPGCSRGLLLLLLLLMGCCSVVVVRADTFRATGGRSARGRRSCRGGGGVGYVTVAGEPCEWTHREAKTTVREK